MIENIIFDLGNVLVDVDYTQFKRVLEENGVSEKVYTEFFVSDKYWKMGYESGNITTEEFIEMCIESLGLNMTHTEFADAFNNMFTEIRPMSDLVRSLSEDGRYNLYMLSNTSPLHFEYAAKHFDYINLLKEFALSYKLKALKPEKIIYERAMQLFKTDPSECLFIDDLAENCRGAELIGIRAIQYDMNNHEKFVSDLNRILEFTI